MSVCLKDRLIPWYFIAFFAVIALVDGIMVTLAIRTQTGLVTEHAYEKGLAYNKIVAAEERQQALGWHSNIEYKNGVLHFMLWDRNGKKLLPDSTKASISRPTQDGLDFSLSLKEGVADIHFPMKGLWEIRIDTEYDGHAYQQSQRLIIE